MKRPVAVVAADGKNGLVLGTSVKPVNGTNGSLPGCSVLPFGTVAICVPTSGMLAPRQSLAGMVQQWMPMNSSDNAAVAPSALPMRAHDGAHMLVTRWTM